MQFAFDIPVTTQFQKFSRPGLDNAMSKKTLFMRISSFSSRYFLVLWCLGTAEVFLLTSLQLQLNHGDILGYLLASRGHICLRILLHFVCSRVHNSGGSKPWPRVASQDKKFVGGTLLNLSTWTGQGKGVSCGCYSEKRCIG